MEGITQDSSSYTKSLRIVVDTNFLVHVFLNPSGYAANVLRYIKDYHTLVMSDYILYETLRTIETLASKTSKYNIASRDLDTWRLCLPYIADEMVVLPDFYLEIESPKIRDKQDIAIFVTALIARSHLLISNDKDLLDNEGIQQYVKVVRVEEFAPYIKKQMSKDERDLLERMVRKHIHSISKTEDA